MALIEVTLFGIEDKMQIAIKRIQHFDPIRLGRGEPYWVAFSGGKDSIVLLDLVRRARGLKTKWKNGQDVWDWWMRDPHDVKHSDQTVLFE